MSNQVIYCFVPCQSPFEYTPAFAQLIPLPWSLHSSRLQMTQCTTATWPPLYTVIELAPGSTLILNDFNHPDADSKALNVHSGLDSSAAFFLQTTTEIGSFENVLCPTRWPQDFAPPTLDLVSTGGPDFMEDLNTGISADCNDHVLMLFWVIDSPSQVVTDSPQIRN
ncbi:hypothetical protein P879_09146 [Paragonimus westermani]|uniref:Uncharacterized protein n=1 Tax=Paragonimus westermani TaxID=34504 RepID=A0A8T0D4S4_9TREM|nr:hypothetical protein P879_09146 [Paragonimus westermani]